MQKWNILYRSNYKIVWINDKNNETKICYLTYKDGKTALPKGWERWFSTTYQLFYYRYIDDNGYKQIQWKSPKKLNQYNYSPEIDNLINLDLKHGTKILEIKNENEDKYVTLIYKGYNIPCTINKKSDIETEIKIEGREDDCLEFSIYIDDVNKKPRTAYIGLISITDNECPLPEKIDKKGTYLLSMVDEICRQLKINTLKLTDGSYITCKKNGETVSLAFLSLMKYGSSWYERNGFSYSDDKTKDIMDKFRKISNKPIGKIVNHFDKLVTDLVKNIKQVEETAQERHLENWYTNHQFKGQGDFQDYLNCLTPTSKRRLITRFNNVKNIKYDFKKLELKEKIERMLEIMRKYDKNLKLHDFLTSLWDTNCSEYVDVMRVLYPKVDTRNYIDQTFLPNFPIYPNMIKVFEEAKE